MQTLCPQGQVKYLDVVGALGEDTVHTGVEGVADDHIFRQVSSQRVFGYDRGDC